MGKQGPCYHCGVTSTPLWRNGPPEKPVLCNACGSRWRTKGTLANYTPLHARNDVYDLEDYKPAKPKTISIKAKEPKFVKRTNYDTSMDAEREVLNNEQFFRKVVDEDISNRSSSGSAISYTESCNNIGGADWNEWAGSAQSSVWESLVPSRKRTSVNRAKPSSVEKLTKDLYSILHEQQMQSYFLSGSSDEDLLYESGTPIDSFEMGQGGVLIKHLMSDHRDEESEASSFPVDSRSQHVGDSSWGTKFLSGGNQGKGLFSSPSAVNIKKHMTQGMHDMPRRDIISHESLFLLENRSSPLTSINLKDIVNLDKFTGIFTQEEQRQLMKYLPSIDVVKPSQSLKNMFGSLQLSETLLYFQKLLSEGVLDLSCNMMNKEECRILKQHALVNLSKCKWVGYYQQLKTVKHKQSLGSKDFSFGLFCKKLNKRPCAVENQYFQESRVATKYLKITKKGGHATCSIGSSLDMIDRSIRTSDDSDASCINPNNIFAFATDKNSCMLDSLQFSDESSEQDLLLDVPSNTYFPQAELLNCASLKLGCLEDQIEDVEEALNSHSSVTFRSKA